MRLLRWLVVAAIAVPAIAAAEPLTVVAPADGAVLRGGSVATIAWDAAAPLHGAEEWEAFLSVDGGHYYSTRITPHLDIGIRSFEWRVPNVSSGDVRLLIRIGDERDETEIDVPLRLSIAASPEVLPSFVPVARARGESARPGDPGVVEWATGDRAGQEVVYQRAPIGPSVQRAPHARTGPRHAVVRGAAFAPPRTSLLIACTLATAPRSRTALPLLARDILLMVRRRNI